eukprot:scaffold189892_cov37-Prasinocladus_malaysianus.AAC.1
MLKRLQVTLLIVLPSKPIGTDELAMNVTSKLQHGRYILLFSVGDSAFQSTIFLLARGQATTAGDRQIAK